MMPNKPQEPASAAAALAPDRQRRWAAEHMTHDFKWGNLIVACAHRLRDSGGLAIPIRDCEVMPPFSGSPDGIFVWFICDTALTKDRFRATCLSRAVEALRTMAVDAGFP